jgi:hypothetical protein
VRSHLLQFDESSALQRYGNNDKLVPVTFPVKAIFPHKQKSLKPLVASLELWWDSNEIFGMPKGDSTCLVRWCSPVSFLCLKQLCSVRCVFCIFADVRQRCCMGCCTAFSCPAVFEKRMEAVIIRSLPEVGDRFLRRSPTFANVRVVPARRLHRSLVFATGCCQLSALLSVLLYRLALRHFRYSSSLEHKSGRSAALSLVVLLIRLLHVTCIFT